MRKVFMAALAALLLGTGRRTPSKHIINVAAMS